jgi:3-hydroxyisobutyrate dehydrogenase-like beta-hydroxyacid dehydrogenase
MGERVVHAGPQGHGSMAKLLNNTLAAINAAAVAQALGVAEAAGLDAAALLEVVRTGSGASTMLELKARPMIERDYDPLFKLEHMLKDVRHLLTEARALGADASIAEAVERLYAQAEAAGLGGRDFAAVMETVAGDGPR